MCAQIGLACCGGGGGCSCGQPSSCPQCQLHPDANAYNQCSESTVSCPFCLNGWRFCSPACKSPGSGAKGCPTPPEYIGNTTATPYCAFANNGAPVPDNCALICRATAIGPQCRNGGPPTGCAQDGCQH